MQGSPYQNRRDGISLSNRHREQHYQCMEQLMFKCLDRLEYLYVSVKGYPLSSTGNPE